MSSGGEQSGIQLQLDGENITEMLQTAPNDNDWESYLETKTRTLTKLPQGEHTLRMSVVGDWINIDKFVFVEYDPTVVDLIDANEPQTFEIYDSTGRKYGELTSSQVDISKKLKEKGFASGTYILKSSRGVIKVIVD